ncbi:MAG: hypothetical protein AB1414_21370, partial [bacterium]
MSVLCEKCNFTNRDIAKYCKSCGQRLSFQPLLSLDELVGLDNIKAEITQIISIVQSLEKRRNLGHAVSRINLNTILIGNTGTGKNKIVEILNSIFYKLDFRKFYATSKILFILINLFILLKEGKIRLKSLMIFLQLIL